MSAVHPADAGWERRVRQRTQDDVKEYSCPISHHLIHEPVTTADGHLYEESAIRKWLQTNSTSPRTGQVLAHKVLTPAHAVKNAIERLVKTGDVPKEESREWWLQTGKKLLARGLLSEAKSALKTSLNQGEATAGYHLGLVYIKRAAEAQMPHAIAISDYADRLAAEAAVDSDDSDDDSDDDDDDSDFSLAANVQVEAQNVVGEPAFAPSVEELPAQRASRSRPVRAISPPSTSRVDLSREFVQIQSLDDVAVGDLVRVADITTLNDVWPTQTRGSGSLPQGAARSVTADIRAQAGKRMWVVRIDQGRCALELRLQAHSGRSRWFPLGGCIERAARLADVSN